GAWHHVVGTVGPAGIAMYLDGRLIGQRSDTGAQDYMGYWRVGGDSTWAGAKYFAGAVDEVAVYPVALTANQVIRHYTVGATGQADNEPPTASFTASASGMTVSVDGTGSTDTDGTVAGYAWNFGDGTSGMGKTASHTYAAAGTYSVTLTVTDDKGATGSVTHSVTVTAANAAPTASFISSVSNPAAFDGSASADSDGTVAGYAWAFGDGTSGMGKTASHTYAAAGTYSVTLTVTDDKGATGSVTHPVTVTATPPLASDAFGRTLTTGFGTADVGGAWTISGATGSTSVSGGLGHLKVATAGASVSAYLNSVSVADVAIQTEFSLAAMPVGGPTYLSLVGRHVGTTDYRAVLRANPTGTVTITLSRFVAGVETKLSAVTMPNLTYTAGTVLVVRLDVGGSGTSALKAKTWVRGSVEPAAWQVTAQDSTADLQRAGAIGLIAYASSTSTALPVQVGVDNLWAGRSGSTPAA
ncbi:MAG: cell surface protein, partial [Streptosporangiaceae bacterium]|nr:cell surface protein [Streptosporangiaceae bacterium]